MSGKRERGDTEYRFFIDKKGNWFQDGIRIRHRGTYLYNNRLLDMDEEGRFFVDEGSGRLYVEVEDTPYVVKMIDRRGEDISVKLNDGTEETLDLVSLRLSGENVPYVRVKNNRFEARLLSPAYYELMKYVRKEESDYFIELGGLRHYLKKE